MINFANGDHWQWAGDLDAVRFTVHENSKPIDCKVSRECLADHCGNPTTPEDCLDAAKRHSYMIENKIGHLIAIGKFEPDGTILLRSADW